MVGIKLEQNICISQIINLVNGVVVIADVMQIYYIALKKTQEGNSLKNIHSISKYLLNNFKTVHHSKKYKPIAETLH